MLIHIDARKKEVCIHDHFFLIQIETIPEKQCFHIVVHIYREDGSIKYVLVAYQPGLDLHAPLEKLIVLGDGGVQY